MEDTQDKGTESRELIEEMLRNTEKAPEPGAGVGEIIHSGDGEMEVPIVLTSLKSAGHSYIYDTRTGERSLTNNNMLSAQLRKAREDGSLVFTARKPSVVPTRGAHKCLLHITNPNRKKYDEMGLSVCRKSNLINSLQVRQHMLHRHKVEFQAIEHDRIEKEKQEERDFQRNLMGGLKSPNPVVRTDTSTNKRKEKAFADTATSSPTSLQCIDCGKICKSEFGLRSHTRKHK